MNDAFANFFKAAATKEVVVQLRSKEAAINARRTLYAARSRESCKELYLVAATVELTVDENTLIGKPKPFKLSTAETLTQCLK